MIIGNLLVENGVGMSAGGYAHGSEAGLKQSRNNIFASNHLDHNCDGGQINPSHGGDGAVSGDYWTANTIEGDAFPYHPLPRHSAGVTIFDPESAMDDPPQDPDDDNGGWWWPWPWPRPNHSSLDVQR